MKRGAPSHPKMRALASALGAPRHVAVGIMEMIWHFAAEYAPTGDIGRYSDQAIAELVDWQKPAHELVNVLVSEHWLDKSRAHRLIIHDWHEHCEDSVHMKLARQGKLFASGQVPSMKRLSDKEKKDAEVLFCAHKNAQRARTPRTRAQKTALPGPSLALPKPGPAGGGPLCAQGAPTPTPTPPLTAEEFAQPDPEELGKLLVDRLMPNHWKPGDTRMAIRSAARILATSVDPLAEIESICRKHATHVEWHAANPRAHKKSLAFWFSDDDYLHPAVKQQKESQTGW